MSEERLPANAKPESPGFSPHRSSPFAERGITHLAGRNRSLTTPWRAMELWSFLGYGRNAGTRVIPEAVVFHRQSVRVELIQWCQWVCGLWYESRLYDQTFISPVTGGAALEERSSTWTSFDEATIYAKQHGLNGLGFILTRNDPFAVLEVPSCRDRSTGAIQSWAVDLVRQIDSYTEVSPTGLDLRIFVRAPELDAEGQIQTSSGRSVKLIGQRGLVPITGHHVAGTPITIQSRGSELASFLRRQGPAREVWLGSMSHSSSLQLNGIAEGIAVVGSLDGHVYGLDAQTGVPRWWFQVNEPGFLPSVTPQGDFLYVSGRDNRLFQLSVATGSILWRAKSRAGHVIHLESQYSRERLAVFSMLTDSVDAQHQVAAFDGLTGEERFRYPWMSEYPHLHVHPAGVVLIPTEEGLYAADRSTGLPRWHLEGMFRPGIVIDHDRVHVVSADGDTLYALDVFEGSVLWRWISRQELDLEGGVKVPGGVVYRTADEIGVVDSRSGFQRWRLDGCQEVNDWEDESGRYEVTLAGGIDPLAVDGNLYASLRDGSVAAIDPYDGVVRWRIPANFTMVDAGNGMVWAKGLDARLYAFDAGSGSNRWSVVGRGVVLTYNAGDTILVTAEDAALTAIDTDSGAERWTIAGQFVQMMPGLVLIGAPDGMLVAYDQRFGKERWRIPVRDNLRSPTSGIDEVSWKRWVSDRVEFQRTLVKLKDVHVDGDMVHVATDHTLRAFRLN